MSAAILEKIRRQAEISNSLSRQDRKKVTVEYTSLPVEIPSDFLAPLPDPAKTLDVKEIEFGEKDVMKARWDKERNKNGEKIERLPKLWANIPENEGLYAVIIDNVLNEQECKQLIHMAEQSAGGHLGEESIGNNGWQRAMVNGGIDKEYLAVDYRNSDRIIWDNQEVIDRIWKRVMQSPEMKKKFTTMLGSELGLIKLDPKVDLQDPRAAETRYVLKGPNQRMRFLKYGRGQFFREHFDGCYNDPVDSSRSYFTVHVYLNDSAQALGHPINLDEEEDSPDALLEGGATSFFSPNYMMDKRYDADPKVGRVLIFRQRGLLHSGDDVRRGIKYTMRTDLMYLPDLDFDLPGGSKDVKVTDNSKS